MFRVLYHALWRNILKCDSARRSLHCQQKMRKQQWDKVAEHLLELPKMALMV